jgi:hypothetical protein
MTTQAKAMAAMVQNVKFTDIGLTLRPPQLAAFLWCRYRFEVVVE